MLIFLIVMWHVASLNVGRNLVPSPWATLLAGQAMTADGRLFVALRNSLSGYFLAAGTAISIGLAMGAIRPDRQDAGSPCLRACRHLVGSKAIG